MCESVLQRRIDKCVRCWLSELCWLCAWALLAAVCGGLRAMTTCRPAIRSCQSAEGALGTGQDWAAVFVSPATAHLIRSAIQRKITEQSFKGRGLPPLQRHSKVASLSLSLSLSLYRPISFFLLLRLLYSFSLLCEISLSLLSLPHPVFILLHLPPYGPVLVNEVQSLMTQEPGGSLPFLLFPHFLSFSVFPNPSLAGP